jgi:hypothetical protein
MKKRSNKHVSRKLIAGQPGTKRMVEKYGDNLICVRYRYDPEKRIKLKTVEIVVDKGYWPGARTEKVKIRLEYSEGVLRTRVKAEGGRWDPEKRLWEIEYEAVKRLRLTERIVTK